MTDSIFSENCGSPESPEPDGKMTNESQTRRRSGYVDKIISNSFEKLSGSARRDFAIALYMSIKLDRSGGTPPRPASGHLILSTLPNLGITFLDGAKILIQKGDAIQFLLDFGVPKISKTSFMKKHNVSSYEELFKRKAVTIKGKTLLATYAEWLHMYGEFMYEPELPAELMSLIPPDWQMPDRILFSCS